MLKRSLVRGGARIAYRTVGDGPPLVSLHPFLFSTDIWYTASPVAGLTDHYTVVLIDHLAHGDSDGPLDPDRYTLQENVANVVAVLDALGVEDAHVWGYSLGAWVGTGLALHHPGRVRSLTIGGWDVVDGGLTQLRAISNGEFVPFDALLAAVRASAPELVEWVTPDREPAMTACWQALFDEMPPGDTAAAVSAMGERALMWNGQDDAYHSTMHGWAEAAGIDYFAVPGDHSAAPFVSAAAVAERSLRFLSRDGARRLDVESA